jgi:LPS-assembly lipoprotein
MWWHEGDRAFGGMLAARVARLTAAFLLAAATGGCFQPLYGTQTVGGAPALREALSAVDVLQIEAPKASDEARLAVQIRNALLFDLTGGDAGLPPTHRLKIQMSSNRATVIVDLNSRRPDIENYGINATYSLTEIATGKVVVTGTTFARVSYDIPGQQQRYARLRGLRDAEDRAAKVIADNIRTRLASYFLAGS